MKAMPSWSSALAFAAQWWYIAVLFTKMYFDTDINPIFGHFKRSIPLPSLMLSISNFNTFIYLELKIWTGAVPPIKKFNWILPPFLFWVHRNETSNVSMKKLALIFVCKICFFLFPKWRFSFKNFLSTAAIWASNQFFLDLSTLSNTHNIWAMESQTQMQKSVDRQKSCLQKYEWLKWRKMISFPPHFI